MSRHLFRLALALLLLLSPALAAQTSTPEIQIPRLIRLSGTLTDLSGSESSSLESITFTLYQDQAGTNPLWSETQNVQVGPGGRYQVLLGSDTPDGIPLSLFSAAEARWLGVRRVGQEEQPLVMFVSVPYALKAADAESLGGKPPSAYLTVDPPGSAPDKDKAASQPRVVTGNAVGPITGEGRERYHARFTGPHTLTWSRIFESSTGIGIYTDTPRSAFDVSGEITAQAFTVKETGLPDLWSWDMDADPITPSKSRFRLLWKPPDHPEGWGILTAREGSIALDHDNPRTALDVNGWVTTNGRLTFTQDLGMSTPVFGLLNVDSKFLLTYLPAFHQWNPGGLILMSATADRVGFFNNTPRRGLDVWNEVTATNRLTLAQDTGTTSPTWHIDNTASLFRLYHQPNINTSGTTVMVATRTGRVGIGVYDPVNTLDVAGTVGVQGPVTMKGAVAIEGTTGVQGPVTVTGAVAIEGTTGVKGPVTVTGEVAIKGSGNGLKFPDGSIQTTAATPIPVYAVCMSNVQGPLLPSCDCSEEVSRVVVDKGASCVVSNLPNGCSASSWQFGDDFTYAICCVCR